jgi:hypothetical protein
VQAADVIRYLYVGYIAVLDGSTGDVLQADALAGDNTDVNPTTLELYKGFAYISGATFYNGNGTKYTLNGFPQRAYGASDMLFARVHLKTMDWKYVRTIGGEANDLLYASTMDSKGNWYVGGNVDSSIVNDFGKHGETLDTDDGSFNAVVAQVIKGTGDIKSFHNFGSELEEYTVGTDTLSTNLAYILDIAIGKEGLYVVGSLSSVGPKSSLGLFLVAPQRSLKYCESHSYVQNYLHI